MELLRVKCAFLGVGNRIRGDDAFGPVVVDMLKEKHDGNKDFLFVDCGAAPENFTGKVTDFSPDIVFIFDAVELGALPGVFEMVDIKRIVGILSSTHQLPLSLFIEFILRSGQTEVVFVGMQPKNLGFDEDMSDECRDALSGALALVENMLGA